MVSAAAANPYDHPMLIRIRAFAKVNLALSVGPPLPSGGPGAGMHPIASWMHAIDLCDDVEVQPVESGGRFQVSWAPDAPRPGPIDWAPEADLAFRAHRLLEDHAGRPLPADMRLIKRIPVGGGLGGGSADAAAALMALNLAFGLAYSDQTLRDLSRSLGSDVAFFLDDRDPPPRPAVVTGLGDRIERIAPAAGWVVLVIPEFGCPTGPVYRAFDARPDPLLQEREIHAMAVAGAVHAAPLFNDLLLAAETVRPDLMDVREHAAAAAARGVFMSGSGSTLFALATDDRDAERVRARIVERLPGAAVVAAALV